MRRGQSHSRINSEWILVRAYVHLILCKFYAFRKCRHIVCSLYLAKRQETQEAANNHGFVCLLMGLAVFSHVAVTNRSFAACNSNKMMMHCEKINIYHF